MKVREGEFDVELNMERCIDANDAPYFLIDYYFAGWNKNCVCCSKKNIKVKKNNYFKCECGFLYELDNVGYIIDISTPTPTNIHHLLIWGWVKK